MNLDINKFKPKDIKISDKYSSNLYKFLKKYNKQGYNKVYFNPVDNYDGHLIELDMESLPFANIYMGNMIEGDVIGNSLARIVTGQTLYKLSCNINVKDEWIDITKEFWKRYEAIGRCLFIGHNSWYQDDYNTRFTYADEITRVCNWCGKTERKRIKEIIKHKEIWE
jgi:hypothetical protein